MFKTILQSVGVSLSSVGFGFLLSILLARFLGPEARGIYGSILTITILIAGLSQLGLAQGYVYHRRKSGLNGLSVLIKSCCLLAFTAMVLLLITQQFFLLEVLTPYLLLIVLLSLISSFHSFFQNSAQIDQQLHYYNILKITLPLLNILTVVAFYLVFGELTIFAAVSILILTTLVSALVLGRHVIYREFNEHKVNTSLNNSCEKPALSFSRIWGYSSKIYGTATIGIFINSIDKIVLLGLGTMKEFGLYSVAYGLSRLIGIIPETLSTVIYARFAGKNETELAQVVKRIFAVLFMPLMSLCLLLSLIATWLIAWLFGDDYQAAGLPFIILLFEAVISSLGWLLSQRFNAAGRPGLVFFRQVISIIPLLFIIVYPFEADLLVVVSSALLISALLRLLITLVLYKKVLKESAPRLYPSKAEVCDLLNLILLKKTPLNKAKENNVS
ncbi:lipopolysaccharide biosynthesis protein [Thalassotalea agariperforans]